MGKSNKYLLPFYRQHICPHGDVALLGFTNEDIWQGDLYDLGFGNWDINTAWELDKQYDTIICTRCAYFSQHPSDFIKRCFDSLKDKGTLYVDWGLGDHWRFDNFKVGWIKEGEHEYAYGEENKLWSFVWDDGYLQHEECKRFEEAIKKLGYDNLRNAVFKEIPSVMQLDKMKELFDVKYHVKFIKRPLQLYVLIEGNKIV